MKIILSRKGFDSSAGGCASPIFEDDTFISLPIPEQSGRRAFSDINWRRPIGPIVEDLSRRRRAGERVHLDPDLRFDSLPRKPGWRPLFGQADAAQSHLRKHEVKPGDLFLFFGWFRRVEEWNGRFRYKPGAPDLHMLFGWLEIGDIWRLPEKDSEVPEWACDHPHAGASYKHNTIYVAAQNGSAYNAGVFRSYSERLVLTMPGSSRRSHWRLPQWFHPAARNSTLSYHRAISRWTCGESYVDLKTVGRGQEFVLDTKDYPEAAEWARDLIGAPRLVV